MLTPSSAADGPDDRPPGAHLECELEPSRAAASKARQDARRLLDNCGVASTIAEDLELVLAELLTNAVEQEPDRPIRLAITVGLDAVHLSVTNRVGGDQAPTLPLRGSHRQPVDQLVERGWGLHIVDALTDDLWFRGDNEWTTVLCLRRLHQSTVGRSRPRPTTD